MKKLLLLMVLLVTWGLAGSVSATTIEFFEGNSLIAYDFATDGPFIGFSSTPPPTGKTFFGSYKFNLEGETIDSATISGLWGANPTENTAYNQLFLGTAPNDIKIADTSDTLPSPDPYDDDYVPWSFTFGASDITWLEPLENTKINLYYLWEPGGDVTDQIRFTLSGDSFQIVTSNHNNTPPVPEPSTVLLVGLGILGLAGVSRKKR